jgi:hypothetical protein
MYLDQGPHLVRGGRGGTLIYFRFFCGWEGWREGLIFFVFGTRSWIAILSFSKQLISLHTVLNGLSKFKTIFPYLVNIQVARKSNSLWWNKKRNKIRTSRITLWNVPVWSEFSEWVLMFFFGGGVVWRLVEGGEMRKMKAQSVVCCTLGLFLLVFNLWNFWRNLCDIWILDIYQNLGVINFGPCRLLWCACTTVKQNFVLYL